MSCNVNVFLVPPLGFGTAALHPKDTLPAIKSALESGYRYGNLSLFCAHCI